eukprot:4095459-Alexandrium_andersonii.AAC.1
MPIPSRNGDCTAFYCADPSTTRAPSRESSSKAENFGTGSGRGSPLTALMPHPSRDSDCAAFYPGG